MNISKIQLRKAWLIRWVFHSQDERNKLKQQDIKNKVITFLGPRKSFQDCLKYVEDLYILYLLCPSEKLGLERYNKGTENRRNLFKTTAPTSNSFKTDLYNNLIKSLETEGINSYNYKQLNNKWEKYPQYMIIGHNPGIEAIKVYKLTVNKSDDGNEIIEWEEPKTDGLRIKMKYPYDLKKSF